LADGKVAGVVEGGFGTGAHFADFGSLFEILLATGVFIVARERGNYPVGPNRRSLPPWPLTSAARPRLPRPAILPRADIPLTPIPSSRMRRDSRLSRRPGAR
jgi:hypothetical protein